MLLFNGQQIKFIIKSSTCISVALTHDHISLKKGLYHYADWFGLLTLVVENQLHRIAKIERKNQAAVASVICRQLGFKPGVSSIGARFTPTSARCPARVTGAGAAGASYYSRGS